MNKSDLKDGNVVETREGIKYLYHCKNSDKFLNLDNNGFLWIRHFDENLKWFEDLNELDIMKVYKDYTCKELLWEGKDELKLTEDEKVILINLPKEYKWIVRDHIGSLWIFENKPNSNIFGWFYSTASTLPFPNLFRFIKYEDKEPYSIEKLLKGEEK